MVYMDSDVKEIETQTSWKGESWGKLSFVRSQSPDLQELTKLSFVRLQSDETQDNLQQSPTRHRQDLKESCHPNLTNKKTRASPKRSCKTKARTAKTSTKVAANQVSKGAAKGVRGIEKGSLANWDAQKMQALCTLCVQSCTLVVSDDKTATENPEAGDHI